VPNSEPLIVALGGLWYTPTGFYRVGAAIRLDPVTLTVTARTKIYASALLAVGRNLYVSEYGGIHPRPGRPPRRGEGMVTRSKP